MKMGIFEVMAGRNGEAIGVADLAMAVNVDVALLSESHHDRNSRSNANTIISAHNANTHGIGGHARRSLRSLC